MQGAGNVGRPSRRAVSILCCAVDGTRVPNCRSGASEPQCPGGIFTPGIPAEETFSGEHEGRPLVGGRSFRTACCPCALGEGDLCAGRSSASTHGACSRCPI